MTSLSRRKRPTTARRTTASQTIASLAWFGCVAAGAAAQPPLLPPVVPAPRVTAAEAPLPAPVPNKPAAVSSAPAPLVPTAKPAAIQTVPPPKTLIYQKEPAPAKPAAAAPGGPTLIYQKEPAASAAPVARTMPAAIQQVGMQGPGDPAGVNKLPRHVLDPIRRKGIPPAENLFNIQPEPQLNRGIIEEERGNPTYTRFPEYEPLAERTFAGRAFPPMVRLAEPAYVTHHRLYFEELNGDRYGWEFGPLQPFISAGYFWLNLSNLPYNFALRPCQRYDTSAGKCLPGDPVPYLIYPPELSLTGGLWEAGVTVALFALIP